MKPTCPFFSLNINNKAYCVYDYIAYSRWFLFKLKETTEKIEIGSKYHLEPIFYRSNTQNFFSTTSGRTVSHKEIKKKKLKNK